MSDTWDAVGDVEIEVVTRPHEDRRLEVTVRDCDTASLTLEEARSLVAKLQEAVTAWEQMPPHVPTPRPKPKQGLHLEWYRQIMALPGAFAFGRLHPELRRWDSPLQWEEGPFITGGMRDYFTTHPNVVVPRQPTGAEVMENLWGHIFAVL